MMATQTSEVVRMLPQSIQNIYPFRQNYLTINGHRLHYVDEGPKHPHSNQSVEAPECFLMLHGNPSWSFFFRHLITGLSQQHRAIAPDHIGCGLSDKPDDERYQYTLRQRVDDIEALVDDLQLKDITLIVHDWGGMIGMAFATRRPELIKRLVIMNTAAFPKPASKRLPWSIAMCRQPGLGAYLVRALNAFSIGAIHTCTCRRLDQVERKAYLYPYNSWANRRAIHRFVQDIPLEPGDPSFAELQSTADRLTLFQKHPVLLLWGDQDFVFDHHFLAEWRQRFPQARLKQFPNAGHYLLEDAASEILTEIESFRHENP